MWNKKKSFITYRKFGVNLHFPDFHHILKILLKIEFTINRWFHFFCRIRRLPGSIQNFPFQKYQKFDFWHIVKNTRVLKGDFSTISVPSSNKTLHITRGFRSQNYVKWRWRDDLTILCYMRNVYFRRALRRRLFFRLPTASVLITRNRLIYSVKHTRIWELLWEPVFKYSGSRWHFFQNEDTLVTGLNEKKKRGGGGVHIRVLCINQQVRATESNFYVDEHMAWM